MYLWSSIATLTISITFMVYAAAVIVGQKTWGERFSKDTLKWGTLWPLYLMIWSIKWIHKLIKGGKKKKKKSSDGDSGENTTIIHHHHYHGGQQDQDNGDNR
jgi:hypothetical protein